MKTNKKPLKKPPARRSVKKTAPKKQKGPQSLLEVVLTTLSAASERLFSYYYTAEGCEQLTCGEARMQIEWGTLGLKALGIRRGSYVGIMLQPSPQWVLAEQIIIGSGATSVGIYHNITFKSLEHYFKETGAHTVFVDDEAAYHALEAFRGQLKHVIVSEQLAHALEQQHKKSTLPLLLYTDLLASGKELARRHPKQFDTAIKKLRPNDVAALVYTSGSSGTPKGVMLTHANFLYQLNAIPQRFPLTAADRTLSVLPLAHIFERIIVYFYLSMGLPLRILDDPARLVSVMDNVRPTMMTAVPRLLERVHEGMVKKARQKPIVLRKLALAALAAASTRSPLAPQHGWREKLYELLVYKKLRRALGGKLNYIVSGGAALAPETLRFFHSIGIPVYEGYGMTEAAPVIACSTQAYFKPYSVGKLLAGTQAKISSKGELLVAAGGVMKQYFKLPALTRRTISQDKKGLRWLHTGDKARLEDDYVFIEGRVKELFKTSTGKYVNPVVLEQLLKKHPLIDHALIIGERRKFVSSLLFVDPLHLEQNVTSSKTTVEGELSAWITTVNHELEQWERVRKLTIVWKVLSIAENELTPKMSIQRKILEEKFSQLIAKMYASSA